MNGLRCRTTHQTLSAELPRLRSTRLLDRVRERGHYSLSTERSYVHWVRWSVRFGYGRDGRRLTSAAWVLASPATARRLLS